MCAGHAQRILTGSEPIAPEQPLEKEVHDHHRDPSPGGVDTAALFKRTAGMHVRDLLGRLDCRSSVQEAQRAGPPAPQPGPADTASTAAKYGLLTVARRPRMAEARCVGNPGGHMNHSKPIPVAELP